jgi:hypothetical protein
MYAQQKGSGLTFQQCSNVRPKPELLTDPELPPEHYAKPNHETKNRNRLIIQRNDKLLRAAR